MSQDTQTMTQKIKVKKSAGRPRGRRNRVSSRETIERALNSGKELTELKEIIEHYIEYAEEYRLSPKQVLDFLKADVDLYRWMIDTLDKMEKNKGKGSEDNPKEELPEGQVGNVTTFSLKAVDN